MPTDTLNITDQKVDKRRRDPPKVLVGAALSAKRRGRPPGSRNKKKKDPPPKPKLGWRVNEFAEALGISRSTVLRLISDGRIKVAYVGEKIPIIPFSEGQRLLTPKE